MPLITVEDKQKSGTNLGFVVYAYRTSIYVMGLLPSVFVFLGRSVFCNEKKDTPVLRQP